MPGASQLARRIGIIELIRGLASVSVALFHFGGQLTSPIAQTFTQYGWIGVDVFFVISGFVITLIFFASDYKFRDFSKFIAKRAIRIEPPYIVSIVLAILLWHLSSIIPGYRGGEVSYSLPQIGFHLFYLIPFTSYSWLQPVYWTLAYEAAFYIFAGLTFTFFAHKSSLWIVAAGLSCILAKYIFLFELSWNILEFCIGAILAKQIHSKTSTAGFVALVICSGILCWTNFTVGLFVLATSLCIWLFYSSNVPKLFLWFGSISYSLYLTHILTGGRIVNFSKRFPLDDLSELLVMAMALAASCGFAYIFTVVVERPFIRLSKRISFSRLN